MPVQKTHWGGGGVQDEQQTVWDKEMTAERL